MLLEAGEVDAALCGGLGDWMRGTCNTSCPSFRASPASAGSIRCPALILPNGALFFCDTHVNVDPTAEQIAEMTLLAAKTVRRFGLAPKAALLSHSSFGTSHSPSALKMRKALALLARRAPDFEIDGEMHADAALSEALRARAVSNSPLTGFGQSAGDADAGRRQYRASPCCRPPPRPCWSGRCCWACPSRCM